MSYISIMKPLGIFWRTFVTGNRLFGALCAVAGIETIYEALKRGPFDIGFWELLGFGACAIAVGILYMKAPLFRSKRPFTDDKPN
jgi:uncharacterized membrane protein HdeD (DUF308 family)